jgi:hypothetical protein
MTLFRALPPTALLLAAMIAGCGQSQPQSHADAAERVACQRHADDVYKMRNPDAVYNADTFATSRLDAPFSGQGTVGATTQGLSTQYERSELVSDCIRGGGGTVGAAPDAPAPAEGPPTE